MIPHLEDYISIFRACGISISMALQSLSQLETLYGVREAKIIMNNIDTVIYISTMDWRTNQEVAARIDLPINEIAQMPVDQFIVCRRGQKPFMDLRYQTFDDPEYQKMITEWNKMFEVVKED